MVGYRAYHGPVEKIVPNAQPPHQFTVTAPNRVQVSDVTEFRLGKMKM